MSISFSFFNRVKHVPKPFFASDDVFRRWGSFVQTLTRAALVIPPLYTKIAVVVTRLALWATARVVAHSNLRRFPVARGETNCKFDLLISGGNTLFDVRTFMVP